MKILVLLSILLISRRWIGFSIHLCQISQPVPLTQRKPCTCTQKLLVFLHQRQRGYEQSMDPVSSQGCFYHGRIEQNTLRSQVSRRAEELRARMVASHVWVQLPAPFISQAANPISPCPWNSLLICQKGMVMVAPPRTVTRTEQMKIAVWHRETLVIDVCHCRT